jgi:hypothetical protein
MAIIGRVSVTGEAGIVTTNGASAALAVDGAVKASVRSIAFR